MLARSSTYQSGNWTNHHAYHADGGGNITALVAINQIISGTYRFDPFGNLLSQSGSMAGANLYRFSSKMLVAGALYHYGYRFYDPSYQRWINQDPLGERFERNLYRFVYNNPNSFVDPDGLTGWALYPPQGYWDPEVRNLMNSPEYQQGFREGMGPAFLAGCGLTAAVLAPRAAPAIIAAAGKGLRALGAAGRKTNLPDEYWKKKKAPTQVDPGTRRITEQKPSSRKKEETYERTSHYDEYGRSTGQTHKTDHGEPARHQNPHHHKRDTRSGESCDAEPGVHPQY